MISHMNNALKRGLYVGFLFKFTAIVLSRESTWSHDRSAMNEITATRRDEGKREKKS